MIIKTKDFILRPSRKTDLIEYHNSRNDPIIARNMYHGIYPLSLEQAKIELNNFINDKKDCEKFIIEINKKLAGAIYFHEISKNHKARVGYWLRKEYRNKGIGTKALITITNYGFKKYKLKRITANVVTFNKPSARALEKAGFKLEGILKKNRYKNKKYYDDFLYAKIK